MFFATAWNRPTVPGITCPPPEETEVQQHFKDECDIHNILKRIERGGDPSVLHARRGVYADLTEFEASSFAEASEIINRAYDAFDLLPSAVRQRFANDPEAFVEYIDEHGLDSVAELFGNPPMARDEASGEGTEQANAGAAPSAAAEK